jgi:hypothetical protein
MKKNLATLITLVCVGLANAQVGIGTTNPQTTLQVVGDPGVATIADGVMAPRLTGNELKAKDAVYSSNEIGAIVYVTASVGTASAKTINVTSPGYFYFDGTVWQKLVNGTAQENIYTTNGTIGTGRTVGVVDTVNFDAGTFVIDATNNRVGIGTTTPANSLEISGSSNGSNVFSGLLLRNTSATGGTSHSARIILGSGAARGAYVEGIHTGVINNDHDLAFATSSGASPTEKMRILANGNVGIGTTNPLFKLSVTNDDITTSGNTAMRLTNNGSFLSFEPKSSTVNAFNDIVQAGDARIIFSTDNNNASNSTNGLVIAPWSSAGTISGLRMDEKGHIGIGVIVPNADLDVIGNGTTLDGVVSIQTTSTTNGATNQLISFKSAGGSVIGRINPIAFGGVNYTTTSDIRLKENIKETAYGINDLMKIKVADYYYKTDKNHEDPQTGFLAQQLHGIYPNAVSAGGEDETKNPWGVDYGKLTPLLVKAIQDQQVQIETLRKEIEDLKKEKQK